MAVWRVIEEYSCGKRNERITVAWTRRSLLTQNPLGDPTPKRPVHVLEVISRRDVQEGFQLRVSETRNTPRDIQSPSLHHTIQDIFSPIPQTHQWSARHCHYYSTDLHD
ncbi:hypothetical protein AVEN_115349-1 [Araneus ventricosus]|uniref:Uncharacterized protein n=1 Tax=Araneus ventricosus TaxID=182803 RepID=A0A4Y1ZZD5_ARAVE|nr:hypothetical protein AVEN_115349-1 [Araneus ventricosus]